MQNNLTRECKQTSLLKGAVCASKMNRKYDGKNADRCFKNLQESKEGQLHELLQVCKNMICFLFQRIAVCCIVLFRQKIINQEQPGGGGFGNLSKSTTSSLLSKASR
jgi:PHP family Zn ribbon phosphoesterase